MERVVSAFGLFVMIALAWSMSSHRWRVNWRLVAMGLLLQFAFAWLTLRTEPGRMTFDALGVLFSKILDFVDAGSVFVFGKSFQSFYFAFKVLPTIIFFSSLMSVLYYMGLMQRMVQAMAFVMQRTMRTSGAESLSAAANIFVGQTEAPLVIRPYIARMTNSELMAIMVGGFSTIAGGVLAAYVGMGIDAGHLMTASIISAPAGLLIAKVLQPEVDQPDTLGSAETKLPQSNSNVIEAAAEGEVRRTEIGAQRRGDADCVLGFDRDARLDVDFVGTILFRTKVVARGVAGLSLFTAGLADWRAAAGLCARRRVAGHSHGGQRIHRLRAAFRMDQASRSRRDIKRTVASVADLCLVRLRELRFHRNSNWWYRCVGSGTAQRSRSAGFASDAGWHVGLPHDRVCRRDAAVSGEGMSRVIALEEHPQGVIVPVKAQPRARRIGLAGQLAGVLKVQVAQASEDGKATDAVLKLLADVLNVKRPQVKLLSGASSRQKRFLVTDLSLADVSTRLRLKLETV